jgi:hypothetical protein
MGPDQPDDFIEEETDSILSDARKIEPLFGKFFQFFHRRFNIEIIPMDFVDYILINNIRINNTLVSPVMLCMHVVYLLIHSYYEALSKKDVLTDEEINLTSEIKESLPPAELWDFEPDECYLNLARNFAINFIEDIKEE